jgi:hypothetical protein
MRWERLLFRWWTVIVMMASVGARSIQERLETEYYFTAEMGFTGLARKFLPYPGGASSEQSHRLGGALQSTAGARVPGHSGC